MPDENVLMIIRAAGAGAYPDEQIPYLRLADALYPAAATAAKRRRMLQPQELGAASAAEAEARALWEAQREDILLSALTASPGGRPLPILATLRHPTLSGAPSPAGADLPGGATTPLPLHLTPVATPTIPSLSLDPLKSAEALKSAAKPSPQTPRGQEILRSLSGGDVMPATPRTIADRVARARRAGLKTAQKGAMALTSRLSVPIGSPSQVPLPSSSSGTASPRPARLGTEPADGVPPAPGSPREMSGRNYRS